MAYGYDLMAAGWNTSGTMSTGVPEAEMFANTAVVRKVIAGLTSKACGER